MPHKDPIVAAAYFKAYREKNRELLSVRCKEYRERNKVKISQMKREDYERHRDAYISRSRKRWESRKDEFNAHRRTPEYRAKKNAKRKEWWASRPLWEKKYYSGLALAYDRKHAEFGESDGLKLWYQNAFKETTAACEYCSSVVESALAHVDHKQPYRFGGLHEASNLAVACSNCNRLKGSTPWEVWSAYLEKKRGGLWQ